MHCTCFEFDADIHLPNRIDPCTPAPQSGADSVPDPEEHLSLSLSLSLSPLGFSPFEFSLRRDWFCGTVVLEIIPNVGGPACEGRDVGLPNHLSRGEK